MSGRLDRRAGVEPATLRPGYLAALALVLALVLGAFAWYELRQTRRVMLETMRQGAGSLAEAVARAGENALRADQEMVALVEERLLDNARLVRDLGQGRVLADSALERLAVENALYRIDVVDAEGELLASSEAGGEGEDWRGELEPLLQGEEQELVFELDQELYAVAVTRPGGGAVLVRASAERLLELRRASGMGRLIQELGAHPDVVYMVLQDSLGILSASRGVEQMGRIGGDPFLEGALRGQEAAWRLAEYQGREIFETVLPFAPQGEVPGLLRIGLSLEKLRLQERSDRLQLVLLAALLIAIGGVAAGVVAIRQNYALLGEAYARVQTYSSRILEQMGDAVVATDPEGRVEVFNRGAERLFGAFREEALGKPLREIWQDETGIIGRLVHKGQEVHGETIRYQGAGGGERTLLVSGSLVRDAGGKVESAVFVVQDLSEKVALEAQVRRRERLASMGALASGVAHEVRNPLNAIGVIAQRLQKEFAPTAEAGEYGRLLGVVRDQVGRVNRIVQQFLSLAKPPPLQKREVDLGELLERAAQAVEPRAREKGLALERDFAGLGTIQADAEQLEQALLNLLNNAVEATQRGWVRLGARPLGEGQIEIAVEDTGEGIPPEHLERVFDLYFSTKAEGTGLGLSLVQRIAAEHGGRVEVHSVPGEGARFTMVLPGGR